MAFLHYDNNRKQTTTIGSYFDFNGNFSGVGFGCGEFYQELF